MATNLKTTFPARHKGPFERVRARMNFATVLASWGEGLSITSLIGEANWLKLAEPDAPAKEWGPGTPGRDDEAAVKVWSPWQEFVVETIGAGGGGTYVDLWLEGGEMGATYLVTVGLNLSNGEKRYRSAAVTIAQK